MYCSWTVRGGNVVFRSNLSNLEILSLKDVLNSIQLTNSRSFSTNKMSTHKINCINLCVLLNICTLLGFPNDNSCKYLDSNRYVRWIYGHTQECMHVHTYTHTHRYKHMCTVHSHTSWFPWQPLWEILPSRSSLPQV